MAKYQICKKSLVLCNPKNGKFSCCFKFSVLNTEKDSWSNEYTMFFGPFEEGLLTMEEIEEHWFKLFISNKQFKLYFKDSSLVEPYVSKVQKKGDDSNELSDQDLVLSLLKGDDNA